MAVPTTKFDVFDYLASPEDRVAYLQAALEEGDASMLAIAIGDIARSMGMAAFARKAGISREALYKAFAPGGNPTLETLDRALRVLGVRLSVELSEARDPPKRKRKPAETSKAA